MSSKILVGAVLVSGLFASMTLGEVFLDRTENIVGYADVELRPGHNLLAVPFQDIGSTNGVVDIQSAIRSAGLTGLDWITRSGGDFIKLWNPLTCVYDSTSRCGPTARSRAGDSMTRGSRFRPSDSRTSSPSRRAIGTASRCEPTARLSAGGLWTTASPPSPAASPA